MEIFIDGGLFELLFAIAFGYAINFIFLKKYLLIIFSVVVLLAPIALFFFNSGELHYWIIGISLMNSILLVVLLWKQRSDHPGKPLINIGKLKSKFYNADLKNRFVNLFQKFMK